MSWSAAFRKAAEVEAEGASYFADVLKAAPRSKLEPSAAELSHDNGIDTEDGNEPGGFCQPAGLATFVRQNIVGLSAPEGGKVAAVNNSHSSNSSDTSSSNNNSNNTVVGEPAHGVIKKAVEVKLNIESKFETATVVAEKDEPPTSNTSSTNDDSSAASSSKTKILKEATRCNGGGQGSHSPSQLTLSSTTAYAPSIAYAIATMMDDSSSWTKLHQRRRHRHSSSRPKSSWMKPRAYAAWVARQRSKKKLLRNLGRLGFGNIS